MADHHSSQLGAVVSNRAHGVTVSWSGNAGDAAIDASAAPALAHGGASVRSRSFRLTLRIAALLAEAGYHCEHTGDRVLVGHPTI
ncbi:hypothetical protein [Streptacidiphilus neutrinimicus]|uniref:hypothetical protein n=1 Tax=Streptacidiphilus neutrinimicus TaxID=105420 RepID=UPI00126A249A|nr:hypothetical protein [Streptacidiphilus neutrinimicus]